MMYKRIIEKLIHEDLFCCAYTHENEDGSFYYGKILAVDDAYFAMDTLLGNGVNDGILIMSLENLLRIETGGQYERKMEILRQINGFQPFFPIPWEYPHLDAGIRYAQTHNRIVHVQLKAGENNALTGLPEVCEKGFCSLKLIDSYGMEDGECIFPLEDINLISFGSSSEVRVEQLWTYYHSRL